MPILDEGRAAIAGGGVERCSRLAQETSQTCPGQAGTAIGAVMRGRFDTDLTAVSEIDRIVADIGTPHGAT